MCKTMCKTSVKRVSQPKKKKKTTHQKRTTKMDDGNEAPSFEEQLSALERIENMTEKLQKEVHIYCEQMLSTFISFPCLLPLPSFPFVQSKTGVCLCLEQIDGSLAVHGKESHP